MIKPTPQKCKTCGKDFLATKKRYIQQFCSDICRHDGQKKYEREYAHNKRLILYLKKIEIAGGNKNMKYLEENQQFSFEIKKESCWVCGTKENLVAHHVKYYPDSEIKILCRKCHSFLHMTLLKRKPCLFKVS